MMRHAIRLSCAGLLLALSVHAAAPDAAAWTRELAAARARIASASGTGEVQRVRDREWARLTAGFPVFMDWTLQDLGHDATGLIDPVRHEATARRLIDAITKSGARADGDPLAAYVTLATERRKARIAATLAKWAPFAFTEGHTYHMSFIGYTEGLSDARKERFFRPGARLAILEFADGALFGTKRTLIDDANGMLRDVDVSFDRERLLFAWKKSDRLDDYHVHELRLRDNAIRQLTRGLGRADYEPVYLPDGDIVFTSTRPEQSVPCWWTEISNLYRMDGEGRYIRRLAIDQVHALYPQLLADGRLTYTRWDYNDRGQNYPHPIFAMRPDGQDQRAFYGGNSWFPTSLLHTRGIPGSPKAMSIAAGHHTLQQGKLLVLDPSQGRDEGPGMTFIAPKRVVPYERKDRAMQDGDLFRYPYPFSETEFLVSYKPGWGTDRFGLYWMNADGERELLHADAALDVARMVAVGRRLEAPVLADTVDYTKKTGTYYVHDVYRGIGLEGVPRGTAKKIRVVRLNYRAAGVGQTDNGGEGGGSLNSSPVAVANGSWDVKEILGDVDIEADGSALFEVPAMESIYLQVLDDRGRVIQTTRSWDTLRPGEQKGCSGCHDKANGNRHPFAREDTLAWKRGAQKLQPFHGPTRGFSFAKEIQPILNAKCVSCHDGTKTNAMDLRGVAVSGSNRNLRAWSVSYLNLVQAELSGGGNYFRREPEHGLVSWISKMSRPTEIPPYFAGAAKSGLLPLLDKGHYDAKLTATEYEKFAAWMDLLVPFCGDYREGNAWNDRQMAYYDYYEGKRGIEAAEEAAAVRAYLAKITGRKTSDSRADDFTGARYREVLANVALSGADHLLRPPTQTEPAMVDRLWLRRERGDKDERVTVRDTGANDELAAATLPADGTARMIPLARPVRSDLLEVKTAGNAPIHLDRALGVLVKEVPQIHGYHPFLELKPPSAGKVAQQ